MKGTIGAVALALVMLSCSKTSTIEDKDSDAIIATKSTAPSATTEQGDSVDSLSLDFRKFLVPSAPTDSATLVSEAAGIFIGPDSLQIEQMISEFGEEDFYTIADDNGYYQSEAGDFLKRKNVKVIYPKTRYLKFKTATDKEINFDTKAKANKGWLTIFFDPKKEAPAVINPVDIDFEYGSYYIGK